MILGGELLESIIFDFGRVIANFDHMKICSRLADFSELSPQEIYDLIFKSSGLEKLYDEGKITSKEFYNLVTKIVRANEKLTFELFEKIWGDIFSENLGIEKVLQSVKPDVKIMLLSNTNEIHWRYMSQLSVIKKYFYDDRNLILSFRLGFRKPDKKIFIEGIKKSGCNPEEIVYVDDIPEYVITAIELGMNGITYDCSTESPEKLQFALSKFGILK